MRFFREQKWRHNINRSFNQGFTLVELLVGLVITVVLLSGVLGILGVSVRAWGAGRSQVEVQQTARYAIDLMSRELRYADSRGYSLPDSRTIVFYDLRTGNQLKYNVSTTDFILYRENLTTGGGPQPITGANVQNVNNVQINNDGSALFSFPTPGDNLTVSITLKATDTFTGQTAVLRTAVSSLSRYLK